MFGWRHLWTIFSRNKRDSERRTDGLQILLAFPRAPPCESFCLNGTAFIDVFDPAVNSSKKHSGSDDLSGMNGNHPFSAIFWISFTTACSPALIWSCTNRYTIQYTRALHYHAETTTLSDYKNTFIGKWSDCRCGSVADTPIWRGIQWQLMIHTWGGSQWPLVNA